jgi:acyl-CoA synthetase
MTIPAYQSEAIAADRQRLRRHWYEAGYHAPVTVIEALMHAAEKRPDTKLHFYTESALRESGLRSCTTATLVRDGLSIAASLQRLGMHPGDVVAVQLPTWYETAVIYVAAFAAGATILPIVHGYGPAEVSFMLRQSRARWLFMAAHWRHIDYCEQFEQLGALPDLARLVVLGSRRPAGAIDWRTLLEQAPAPLLPAPIGADDVCLLLYTSGTTAEPKGVRHSHNTVRSEWEIPFFDSDGLYLSPFPAGHIAGFNALLRPMVCGVPMLFLERWDASLAARLIEQMKVRQTGGTPYFLLTLLDAARSGHHDLSSLQFYGIGGTAVTPEQVRLIDDNLCPGGRTYGLTEHSTVTRSDQRMPFEKRAGTDGKVQPGTEVRIVDELDAPLPIGSQGDILVRGPELFVGYTDPALDASSFAPGGWFRTGDIGYLDPEGFLTVCDRRKDIIIRAGENISSREVEEAVARHPAIAEVAVIATPDPYYGERPCAYAILKPNTSLTLAELRAHCAAMGLARLKTPEQLLLVDDLPRTPAGKVRKSELRKRPV